MGFRAEGPVDYLAPAEGRVKRPLPSHLGPTARQICLNESAISMPRVMGDTLPSKGEENEFGMFA